MKRRSRKVSKRRSRKVSKRKPRKVSKRKPRKVSKKKSRKRSRRKRKQKILRARASSKKPVAHVHIVNFVPGRDKSLVMKTLRNPEHGDLVENVGGSGFRTQEVYVIKKNPAGSNPKFEMSDLDHSFSEYGHIGNGFSIGPNFPSGYWFNAGAVEFIEASWEAHIEPVGVEIWSAIKPTDLKREVRDDGVIFWKYEKPWGVLRFRADSAAEVCNALNKYKKSTLAAQGGLTLYMVEGEIEGAGHGITWDAIKSL